MRIQNTSNDLLLGWQKKEERRKKKRTKTSRLPSTSCSSSWHHLLHYGSCDSTFSVIRCPSPDPHNARNGCGGCHCPASKDFSLQENSHHSGRRHVDGLVLYCPFITGFVGCFHHRGCQRVKGKGKQTNEQTNNALYADPPEKKGFH